MMLRVHKVNKLATESCGLFWHTATFAHWWEYSGTQDHQIPVVLRLKDVGLQDNLIYQASYDQWACEVNPNSVAPNGAFKPDQYIFGPRFFQAIERFPQGTPITYGAEKVLRQMQPQHLTDSFRAQPCLPTA
jgi:hypothetical protein